MAARVTYSRKYQTELSKIGECVNPEAEDHESEELDCCGGTPPQDNKPKFEIIGLEQPLEGDCTFELIDFESPEGKEVSKPHQPSPIELNTFSFQYPIEATINQHSLFLLTLFLTNKQGFLA